MSGPTTQLAYAEAYRIKESLGGGFRGACHNVITKEVKKGEVRETLEQAKFDAKTFVFEFAAGRNMTSAPYHGIPRKLWKCNYFIRSDEV